MTLGRLIELCPPQDLRTPPEANWTTEEILSLAFDSRQAGPGTVFFALSGTHTDGHQFLDDVAQLGCRAVVVSQFPASLRQDTVYALVADPRATMSLWAAQLYQHPSREFCVIGVTGTDGKSSTVSFIHQLLTLSGERAGFFSTVEWSAGGEVHHNQGRQSTPEAPQVQAVLRQMVGAGCRFAVIEATSHGLSPKTSRLADVCWSAAVFTNVTLEHLEFHGTVENYRADKARLFSALEKGRNGAFGVINLDDPHHQLFLDAAGSSAALTYSLASPSAGLSLSSLLEEPDGLVLGVLYQGRSLTTRLNIPGRFNASNLLAALLAVSGVLTASGRPTTPLDLLPLVPQIKAVKGRMAPVRAGQDFAVLVDYAHTPGAFEAILPAIKAVTSGRVITVFGSGGERDRTKRPLQGAVADRWADLIVLTDEDPRLEDPQRILEDIEAGIRNKKLGEGYWKITPRREALRHALSLAQKGDTVLLLGKGHERTLVTAQGSQPWDEGTVAHELLLELSSAAGS